MAPLYDVRTERDRGVKEAPKLRTNSIDFVYVKGGATKIPTVCGRQIGEPLSLPGVSEGTCQEFRSCPILQLLSIMRLPTHLKEESFLTFLDEKHCPIRVIPPQSGLFMLTFERALIKQR